MTTEEREALLRLIRLGSRVLASRLPPATRQALTRMAQEGLVVEVQLPDGQTLEVRRWAREGAARLRLKLD